jgi:hypothetical protein
MQKYENMQPAWQYDNRFSNLLHLNLENTAFGTTWLQ